MTADDCALRRACLALWSATLALMTAYMQQRAPAHRLLLARRIAANLRTLSQQETFSAQSRAAFARLTQRWDATAAALTRPPTSQRGSGLLQRLLPFDPRAL